MNPFGILSRLKQDRSWHPREMFQSCNKNEHLVLQQTALGLNRWCPAKPSISRVLKGVTVNNYKVTRKQRVATSDMTGSSCKELCKAVEQSNQIMKPKEMKSRGFNPWCYAFPVFTMNFMTTSMFVRITPCRAADNMCTSAGIDKLVFGHLQTSFSGTISQVCM